MGVGDELEHLGAIAMRLQQQRPQPVDMGLGLADLRGDAIALVYGTVMRNLSIALALAMNVFGPAGAQAALVIALAYVVQVQSAAWYVRLTDRIFGPKP